MWSVKTVNSNRLIIRGIVSFLVGITIIVYPGLTLVNVIKGLGSLLIIDGIIALLINAFSKKQQSKGFYIVPRGTSNVAFGLILLIFPAALVNVFVFLIGFILLIAGFTLFASQISERRLLGTSWVIMTISILSFIAGVTFLFKPFESAETMLTVFGVIIALYGIGEVIWSFKIRKYQKQNPIQPENIVDAEYEEIEEQ